MQRELMRDERNLPSARGKVKVALILLLLLIPLQV
jgi:hypothetical protein